MPVFIHLIKKELIQFRRTRSMIAIALGMPIVQLLISRVCYFRGCNQRTHSGFRQRQQRYEQGDGSENIEYQLSES